MADEKIVENLWHVTRCALTVGAVGSVQMVVGSVLCECVQFVVFSVFRRLFLGTLAVFVSLTVLNALSLFTRVYAQLSRWFLCSRTISIGR